MRDVSDGMASRIWVTIERTCKWTAKKIGYRQHIGIEHQDLQCKRGLITRVSVNQSSVRYLSGRSSCVTFIPERHAGESGLIVLLVSHALRRLWDVPAAQALFDVNCGRRIVICPNANPIAGIKRPSRRSGRIPKTGTTRCRRMLNWIIKALPGLRVACGSWFNTALLFAYGLYYDGWRSWRDFRERETLNHQGVRRRAIYNSVC